MHKVEDPAYPTHALNGTAKLFLFGNATIVVKVKFECLVYGFCVHVSLLTTRVNGLILSDLAFVDICWLVMLSSVVYHLYIDVKSV